MSGKNGLGAGIPKFAIVGRPICPVCHKLAMAHSGGSAGERRYWCKECGISGTAQQVAEGRKRRGRPMKAIKERPICPVCHVKTWSLGISNGKRRFVCPNCGTTASAARFAGAALARGNGTCPDCDRLTKAVLFLQSALDDSEGHTLTCKTERAALLAAADVALMEVKAFVDWFDAK